MLFVDHAGLSDLGRVSAEDLAKLLVRVGPGSRLHGQLKEIVPLDVEGEKVPDAAWVFSKSSVGHRGLQGEPPESAPTFIDFFVSFNLR